MISIFKGTSHKLAFYSADYQSPDWSGKVAITNADDAEEFTLSADGQGGFEVTLTTVQTNSLKVGVSDFAVVVTMDDETTVAETGRLEVKADPTEAGDKRTQAEKDLEAVEGAIRSIIEGGAVQSYQIQTTVGSRQLTRMTLEELEKLRLRLKRQTGQLKNDRWRPIKSCLGGHHHRRRGR